MNIVSSLNQKQKEAVTLIKGPVLVIAGPGSGKTKCLTHRIAYLIQQGVPFYNILAVTFTNKAAQEMKERVRRLVSGLPSIGTFHAICVQILRREIKALGYEKQFTIYDSNDQITLIKKIIKNLEISTDQFNPRVVQSTISKAKNELINCKEYENEAADYFPQTISRIYSEYQKELKKANSLDFDDLIMLVVKLFRKNPEILEKYQEKWQYILVDEAHDTNHSQYALTNLLADKHKNIWCIADPDQSIYSWRGADFRNILNFEKDYPDVKTITLEQNYRSTQNILEASHCLISKNAERKEKNLWTNNSAGSLINVNEVADEEEEGEFITAEIDNLINQGYGLENITILYRANAQSRAIEEAFLKAGMPYKIIGNVRFYDRKEIKDIIAYLQYIVNPHDTISFSRIVNTPPRRLARLVKDPSLEVKGFDKFSSLIEELRVLSKKISLTELIKSVIEKTGYERYIRNGKEEGERRWENVQEIFTVAEKYDLEKFLEEVALLGGQDEIEGKGMVNLMTIHCAKGLEFPIVFIVGCEDGVFPHSRSLFEAGQMEEERRLCYVALTRAKEKAYMTFARRRRIFGQTAMNPPSRFVLNLPEHLVDFNSS